MLFENGAKLTVQECPELQQLVGKTLICSAGDTLLGGDDKAGVAIIMELAQSLLENPSLQHGTIKLLMTCDEEIGRGTGLGFNLNVPLPENVSDDDMKVVADVVLLPLMVEFEPEVGLVLFLDINEF